MGRSKAIILHQQQQQQQQSKRSSDVVYRPSNIRIRRAILAGKRGPTTPVPSWKLYENPSYDGIIAGTEVAGRQITISARKLAATLWELQELPLSRALPSSAKSSSATHGRPGSGNGNRRESVGSPERLMLPPPSPATPVPQNYVKPTSTKSSDSHRRSPYSDSITCHSRRASDEMYSETPRHSFEVELKQQQQQQQHQQHRIDEEEKLKSEGVPNSAELLKVLSHIRGMDGHQAGSAPLAAVLRVELEHTRQRVRELEHANKAARRDIEMLVERTEGERALWRAKEQEKCRAAVLAAKQEAEEEKRLRRKSELVNRKLVQQLDELKIQLSKATKDLERERKARQLMEDVCDELAREIGHDKAEVEQLKRESEKVREEVEEERRMLQMAEVWREERVQMKLSEARHELEEKNAALDKLTVELEDFLRRKSAFGQPQGQLDVEKAKMLRSAADSLRRPQDGGSSAEEDLHSIDLNKESLYDRTQGNRWTYNRNHPDYNRQNQQQQIEAPEWNDKKPELRRKVLRGRRRMRKQRTYDENLVEEEQNGNELQNGPVEICTGDGRDDYRRVSSPTMRGGRIEFEPIPEQQELYRCSPSPNDDDFALGFAQRDGNGCRTPTLSPLLHSSSFSVTTPQRNSWSSGELLNPHLTKASRGSVVDWSRIGGRDNSLRAKLLEEQVEEPHHHLHHQHHRSKRDK